MAEMRLPVTKAAYTRTYEPDRNFSGPGEVIPGLYADIPGTDTDPRTRVESYFACLGCAFPNELRFKAITQPLFIWNVDNMERYTNGNWLNFTPRYEAYRIQVPWVEGAVTHNNFPRSGWDDEAVITQFGGTNSHVIAPERVSDTFKFGISIRSVGRAGTPYDLHYINGAHAIGYTYMHISGYGDEDEAKRPFFSFTYEDIVPRVDEMLPTGGYVDERRTQVFTWKFVAEGITVEPVTQKQATIQWRKRGTDDTHTLTAYSDQQVVIPANTFPAQSAIEWRVQVLSSDDIPSEWSPWMELTTVDTVPGATALRPSGQWLDQSKAIIFAWRHGSPTGTEQTRAVLAVRYRGVDGWGEWDTLAGIDGNTQTYTLPPGTLLGGDMEWRVQTYNADGVPGEWSDALTNVVITPPPPPRINHIDPSRSRPDITWQSVEQEVYRVVIQRDGETVHDSGMVQSVERGYLVPVYLENGPYTVLVSVANEYGYWSEPAAYDLVIQAAKPPAPTLTVSKIRHGLRVHLEDIDASIVRVLLYRTEAGRRVLIAALDAPQDTHDDYLVADQALYEARAIDVTDGFADAEPVQAAPVIRYMLLAPFSDPSDVLELSTRRGEPVARAWSYDTRGSLVHFEGRPLPVMEFGDGETLEQLASFTVRGRKGYERLKALVAAKEAVVFRKPDGGKTFCAIQLLDCADETGPTFDVDLPLLAIDLDENVEVIPLARPGVGTLQLRPSQIQAPLYGGDEARGLPIRATVTLGGNQVASSPGVSGRDA